MTTTRRSRYRDPNPKDTFLQIRDTLGHREVQRRAAVRRSIGTVCALVSLTLCAFAANADETPAPELAPPPGVSVVREVQGGGVQVYACRARPDGNYAWSLVGPKALLVNGDGSDFGVHFSGPTWQATDGSSIVADGAHPLATSDRPAGIPALIVVVKSQTGHGVLEGIRYVRRSDTEGGLPPASGCDAAHAAVTVARHYSAIYTFYK